MIILGIETSCDETALALLECNGILEKPSFTILAEELFSQVAIHKPFGGVFPMMAKREHSKNLIPLFKSLLSQASYLKSATSPHKKHTNKLENVGMLLERETELQKQFLEFVPTIAKPSLDAIAVTQGPGLEPALWVGINFAKALSSIWNIPLVPMNHLEGHLASVLLSKQDSAITFPMVALLVSGGHTQLINADRWGSYTMLGETRDDAVGEAFDKVARILGLEYPGGPEISRLADIARKNNYPNFFPLPRPMLHSGNYEFSFSGLKTAVLYGVKKLGNLSNEQRASIAREFEDAAIEVLIGKTRRALRETGATTLIVGGGVVANRYLREQLHELVSGFSGVKLLLPNQKLSTDNAVMIAMAAYLRILTTPAREFRTLRKNITAHGTMNLTKGQG